MKKIFVTVLFLISGCGICFADYFSDSRQTYDINSGSKIGDTYYSWDEKAKTYTSYTQKGNDIYGSDGSHYHQLGNTVQNTATGETYQINGNLVNRLY